MKYLMYPPFNKENLPSNFVNLPYKEDTLTTFSISEKVCDNLLFLYKTFGQKDLYEVGVQGLSTGEDGKGSLRVTNYDPIFAQQLTTCIKKHCPEKLYLDSFSEVDWVSQNPNKYSTWEFKGVSPLFRYMEYTKGSEHFPHYDAPHICKEKPLLRTLYSGVLYLTTNRTGPTAFVDDGQSEIPFVERDLKDWTRQASLKEIKNISLPVKGKVVIFPHQRCHTVLPLMDDEERIIIRFDIYYKATV